MQQPREPDEHTAMLGLFESSRAVALTVGSLGLAAWSVLSAFHPAGIQPRSLGLELLFLGVILSIAAPMFFRLQGSDGSELGLESMVSLGYLALLFALTDIIVQVFDRRWLNLIGVLVVVLMLIREFMEVRDQIRLYWPRVHPDPPDCSGLATALGAVATEKAQGGADPVEFRDGLVAPDNRHAVGRAWPVIFAEVERRLRADQAWPWS